MSKSSLLILIILTLASCSRSVTRLDPATGIDLSGRLNVSDSLQVSDQMIYYLFKSNGFTEYARQLGRKPVIIVGFIRNKTSEHIDAGNFIRKIEFVIHNSGLADLVENEEFRDRLRKERAEQQDFADPATAARWGKELGADVMLFGELNSETDVYNKKRVTNYITTLYLTDIETNRRIWYGQHEIKKLIKN